MSGGARERGASEKDALRARAREAVARLTDGERAAASGAIRGHLAGMLGARGLGAVMLFVPLRSEPDLLPLAEELRARGVVVAMPVVEWSTGTMRPGVYTGLGCLVELGRGVRGPMRDAGEVDPARLGAVVAPGLAFDRRGGRVGRGGGFYDRFLASLGERAGSVVRVGVAFGAQLVDRVPMEPHDARMDAVVTEHGTVWAGNESDRG